MDWLKALRSEEWVNNEEASHWQASLFGSGFQFHESPSRNDQRVRLKPALDLPNGHEVEILDEEGPFELVRIQLKWAKLSISVNVRERRKPFQK